MADFYVRTARTMQDVLTHRGSVKAMSAGHGDKKDAKRIMALVVNTLSYRAALQHILKQVDLVKKEPKWFGSASPLNRTQGALPQPAPSMSDCVMLVMLHDLLFTSRGIQAAKAWPPRERMEKYKSQLHAELVRLQIRQGKKSVEELRSGAAERRVAARIPRWCRINTLQVTEQDALQQLQAAGFTRTESDTLEHVNAFCPSLHVPHVWAFHPRATSKLMSLPLYKTGGLILQDLASCFPAAVLAPPDRDYAQIHALDATSAPGNKTSHLSALMQGQGTLVALERAPQRFKTLTQMLDKAGALATQHGNVYPQNTDFLTLDPQDESYAAIRYMLLDPSCSGSGIVNRLDYLTSHDDEQDNLEQVVPDAESSSVAEQTRLASLASLQQRMIRHAMTFPHLERFTYSTCSIHPEENEHVVMQVLASEEAQQGAWTLAPRAEVLPTWPERGQPEACGGDESVAQCLVRCTPGGTSECSTSAVHRMASNGFFVCCFVRRTASRPAKRARRH